MTIEKEYFDFVVKGFKDFVSHKTAAPPRRPSDSMAQQIYERAMVLVAQDIVGNRTTGADEFSRYYGSIASQGYAGTTNVGANGVHLPLLDTDHNNELESGIFSGDSYIVKKNELEAYARATAYAGAVDRVISKLKSKKIPTAEDQAVDINGTLENLNKNKKFAQGQYEHNYSGMTARLDNAMVIQEYIWKTGVRKTHIELPPLPADFKIPAPEASLKPEAAPAPKPAAPAKGTPLVLSELGRFSAEMGKLGITSGLGHGSVPAAAEAKKPAAPAKGTPLVLKTPSGLDRFNAEMEKLGIKGGFHHEAAPEAKKPAAPAKGTPLVLKAPSGLDRFNAEMEKVGIKGGFNHEAAPEAKKPAALAKEEHKPAAPEAKKPAAPAKEEHKPAVAEAKKPAAPAKEEHKPAAPEAKKPAAPAKEEHKPAVAEAKKPAAPVKEEHKPAAPEAKKPAVKKVAAPETGSRIFTGGQYIVQQGDTMFTIARDACDHLDKVKNALGADVSARDVTLALALMIARKNGIENADRIVCCGKALTLPTDEEIKLGAAALKSGVLADSKINYKGEVKGKDVSDLVALVNAPVPAKEEGKAR